MFKSFHIIAYNCFWDNDALIILLGGRMKQAHKLMIGQAIFTFIIILLFGFIIIHEQGNIFLRGNIKKQIEDYAQENFANHDLQASDLAYHFDNNSYSITYTDQTYPELSFQVSYKKKKIIDTYQQDYIEGKSVLEKRQKQLQEEWDKVFASTIYQVCTLSFAPLNQYSEDQQILLLTNHNLKDSHLYTVTCPTTDNIETLQLIAEKNKFYAQKYDMMNTEGER